MAQLVAAVAFEFNGRTTATSTSSSLEDAWAHWPAEELELVTVAFAKIFVRLKLVFIAQRLGLRVSVSLRPFFGHREAVVFPAAPHARLRCMAGVRGGGTFRGEVL